MDQRSFMFKAYAGLMLTVPVYLMYTFVKDANNVKEGLTSDSSSKLSEINDQTLNDIQRLQDLEKELYAKMEALSASKKLTQKTKDDIIAQINNLTQLRMNLYANLKNNYDQHQIAAITNSNAYDEQSAAVSVVEKELNAAKAKLQLMEDDKTNKMRYIDLNIYYGKQYQNHAEIMKIIIYMCVPIIILSVVAQKGYIPANVVAVIVAIIAAIGIVFLITRIGSAMNRDNMDYDRINWYFDPASAKEDDTTDEDATKNPWESTGSSPECVGQECCDTNSTYDADKNMCVVNVNSDGATESMCNMTSEQSFGSEFSLYNGQNASPSSLNATPSLVDSKLNNYARFNKRVITL